MEYVITTVVLNNQIDDNVFLQKITNNEYLLTLDFYNLVDDRIMDNYLHYFINVLKQLDISDINVYLKNDEFNLYKYSLILGKFISTMVIIPFILVKEFEDEDIVLYKAKINEDVSLPLALFLISIFNTIYNFYMDNNKLTEYEDYDMIKALIKKLELVDKAFSNLIEYIYSKDSLIKDKKTAKEQLACSLK